MSKNVKMTNPMKVITGPNTRWSYANVWEPKSINDGTPKYSVSLIIPKSDTKTVAKIEAAIEAAYREGEAKLKGNGKSVPALSVLKTPLRDGDLERPDDPAYAGSYFINANATSAPGIVDADRNPILTRSEVWCLISRMEKSLLQMPLLSPENYHSLPTAPFMPILATSSSSTTESWRLWRISSNPQMANLSLWPTGSNTISLELKIALM